MFSKRETLIKIRATYITGLGSFRPSSRVQTASATPTMTLLAFFQSPSRSIYFTRPHNNTKIISSPWTHILSAVIFRLICHRDGFLFSYSPGTSAKWLFSSRMLYLFGSNDLRLFSPRFYVSSVIYLLNRKQFTSPLYLRRAYNNNIITSRFTYLRFTSLYATEDVPRVPFRSFFIFYHITV